MGEQPTDRLDALAAVQKGKSLVLYFFTSEAQRQRYVSSVTQLAKRYREYLIFTTVDAREYPDMREGLGLGAGVGSGLAVQNPASGDMFAYDGGVEVSPEVVESFLLDISSGKVRPRKGPARRSHDEL
jgi:protein disulfide-isomerase A1